MQEKSPPSLLNLSAPELAGKRVLLRVDYNFSTTSNPAASIRHRLEASLPTLRMLLQSGARVGILTHRGRPQGRVSPSLSLEPLTPVLAQLLGQPLQFVPDCIGRVAEQALEKLPPGQAVLMENTRFHLGEQLNQIPFAQALSRVGDVLVNDAFATSHRTQASTNALATLLPTVLGLQFIKELAWMQHWQQAPSPRTILLGGEKVSPKIELMQRLLGKAEVLCLGGVVGQTFLAAKDMNLGHSSVDYGAVESARNFLAEAGVLGCRVHLPRDFAVAEKAKPTILHTLRRPHEMENEEVAQDLGPLTLGVWEKIVADAPALIWFGSLGCWEHPTFRVATRTLAEELLKRHKARLGNKTKGFALLAGNGLLHALGEENLLVPLAEAGVHLSTGGAALQQALMGHPLPGLQAVLGR